jgi:hypothetical protein
MKSYYQYGRLLALLFAAIFSICTGFSQAAPSASTVKENTKKLLMEFLINEDMIALEEMLDDSLKFYWPNTRLDTKEGVLKACQSVITTKDNNAEIIDLIVEDNRAFILFVWSGVITKDKNDLIVGKTFAIHDAWKITWENEKVVEWYTIWGSLDYMNQLGYKVTPPGE